ncbi:MAG: TrkH family potassium uptake protein [Pirellulaceae bacterium]|jgi:trk system potassium uptake protein TrkH
MPKLAGSLVRYPARVTTAWFAGGILLGTLLLKSPWSGAKPEAPISWLDAMFTATSALCVTGLSVRSTVQDFTLFGQLVILGLIQLGGIGIMTITTFVLTALAGRTGLRQRAVVAETLGSNSNEDLRWVLWRIFFVTGLIEAIGAMILFARFVWDLPPMTALYHAVFHSISAFCNAGFALHDQSITPYQGDLAVNLTLSILIMLGGIGFPVIIDVYRSFRTSGPKRWDHLHLHTRLTLLTTSVLVVGGALAVAAMEWDGVLVGKPWLNQILIPIFHSISCRTAGFNSIDLAEFSNATLFLSILLMLIGAGACSTAGGVKVSTVAILCAQAWRRFQGHSRVTVFRRTIPEHSVDRAMASLVIFMMLGAIALTMLCIADQSHASHRNQSHDFLDAAFEVASALGTVGLTTGYTTQLGTMGRLVIILLMFLGRVGPLSVFAAVSRDTKESPVQYATQEPLVG